MRARRSSILFIGALASRFCCMDRSTDSPKPHSPSQKASAPAKRAEIGRYSVARDGTVWREARIIIGPLDGAIRLHSGFPFSVRWPARQIFVLPVLRATAKAVEPPLRTDHRRLLSCYADIHYRSGRSAVMVNSDPPQSVHSGHFRDCEDDFVAGRQPRFSAARFHREPFSSSPAACQD